MKPVPRSAPAHRAPAQKATRPAARLSKKGVGPARAPRGAKRRAYGALVSRKQSVSMTSAELHSFWSAASMRIPPPLRTTFGNFSTVNSVCRATVTPSAARNVYVWIPWSPSPLAALVADSGSAPGGIAQAPVSQLLYQTLASSTPASIRPLRMSFSIGAICSTISATGLIRVYSLDNSIALRFQTDVNQGVPPKLLNADTDLDGLLQSCPDVEEFSAMSLAQCEREWVSVPSSYPGYSSYYEFVDFYGTTNSGINLASGNMRSDDLLAICQGHRENFAMEDYTIITTGSNTVGGALGNLPPMRGFIIEFPVFNNTGFAAPQYRLTLHRQDGARYPVNTLGHSFARPAPVLSADGEDRFHALAKMIAESAASGHPRPEVARSNGGEKLTRALAIGKEVITALGPPAIKAIASSAKKGSIAARLLG